MGGADRLLGTVRVKTLVRISGVSRYGELGRLYGLRGLAYEVRLELSRCCSSGLSEFNLSRDRTVGLLRVLVDGSRCLVLSKFRLRINSGLPGTRGVYGTVVRCRRLVLECVPSSNALGLNDKVPTSSFSTSDSGPAPYPRMFFSSVCSAVGGYFNAMYSG